MTPPIFFIYFLLLQKRPILQKERPLLGKIAKTSVPRRYGTFENPLMK